MATFYKGVRPILKGRTTAKNINTYTGKVEKYSNWSLMNSDAIFDGAPETNYVPGTGRSPGDYFMTYLYKGGQHVYPMAGAGSGARLSYFRTRPLEFKGLLSAMAFPAGFGHTANRGTSYEFLDPYTFKGIPGAAALPTASVGHAVRYTSPVNSFGSFGPYVFKGAASAKAMPGTIGQANTVSDYGRYKVNEWKGVASAKAL